MKIIKTKLKKTGIALCCIGLFLSHLSLAQEAGKFRAGVDFGLLLVIIPNDIFGFGAFEAIELKYNLKNNMNLGLKQENLILMDIDNKSVINSISATYDYYSHSKDSRCSPFIGAGLGYFFCKSRNFYNYSNIMVSKYNNPTCFIRTGFEFWKIRTYL